ncbi:hypothetical protein NECAME_17281 [Necator americanus]|uniref:Uncharacterized protein n=1 Tax=Necator americanus TaxID=51031 RepID=W2TSL1_NECAM|nr:hypothetical protein NECAME_17281 [Necator americanus]ETN84027.1 hypothetical protein NECAME_17281 [Necator americanus]
MRMYTASKQPSNLSQSALNYLQSLEKATKALRQNQQVEKKRVGGQHSLLESSRLSSERGSLSSMISQLRHRTRRESTIDEFDDSISEENGHGSERTPSISPSSAGGERIVFDFPFDVAKDDNKQSDALPKQLPGLQMGRKSIHEIRELRSSIDHSLIKPPKLQKQQPRRFSINSVNSYKEDSGSGQQEESEEEPEDLTPKPQAIKKRSPFRPAIESGSDLESIDFEHQLHRAPIVPRVVAPRHLAPVPLQEVAAQRLLLQIRALADQNRQKSPQLRVRYPMPARSRQHCEARRRPTNHPVTAELVTKNAAGE